MKKFLTIIFIIAIMTMGIIACHRYQPMQNETISYLEETNNPSYNNELAYPQQYEQIDYSIVETQ